ncbi:hypothetical protein AAFF_G00020840 [Aldrovandia affinis]|uniref:Uncharacterized protein n=1 Tax=Aldrovandia affinis TaxID=143900 RepID=A0AAD7S5P7_9TELE|nr:hypothetical protein AAFF_G00020840 [Aldrovandia affinis]
MFLKCPSNRPAPYNREKPKGSAPSITRGSAPLEEAAGSCSFRRVTGPGQRMASRFTAPEGSGGKCSARRGAGAAKELPCPRPAKAVNADRIPQLQAGALRTPLCGPDTATEGHLKPQSHRWKWKILAA